VPWPLSPRYTQKRKAISELANHNRKYNAILNCDWPIRLLLMSYCLCLTVYVCVQEDAINANAIKTVYE